MQTSQPPLWARDHTLLGVCEALGEDFGFNPLFLRIPLAVLLLWNPTAVVGAYVVMGLLVLASRLAIPDRSRSEALAETPEPVEAEREMALAA
jgi:phage shock protein PspC (stress-responsive transcriptional regulator)